MAELFSSFLSEDWEAQLREKTRVIPGPCVLDAREDTILNYALGDFSLIDRDLRAVFPEHVVEPLEDSIRDDILAGLAVRRELINYKKVCLHLWQSGLTTEKDLRQLASFFYCDMHADELPTMQRRELYSTVSSTMNDCHGAVVALHDARYFGKTICGMPRHPGSGVPFKFEQFPQCLEIWKLLEQAWQFLRNHNSLDSYYSAMWDTPSASSDAPFVSPTDGTLATESLAAKAESDDLHPSNEVSKPVKNKIPWESERKLVPSAVATDGLKRLLSAVEKAMPMLPPNALRYVELVLIARGAAKALAITAALGRYIAALQRVLREIDATMGGLKELLDASADSARAAGLHLYAEKYWRTLKGAKAVVPEMLRWLEPIGAQTGNSSRIFVSGARGAAAFVPQGFTDLLRPYREVIAVHRTAMFSEIAESGWPKSARPHPEDEVNLHACQTCGEKWTKLWLHRGLCFQCEDATRAKGQCPYNSRCGARSFCPHAKRCIVCELWSCEECCLLRGDGEDVWQLVAQLQPAAIFLDFDRTLATTKRGCSPLEGNHSVDADLASVCADYGRVQVVTRSSRKEDISKFLTMNDVPVLRIHSLKRDGRASKAEVIYEEMALLDSSDSVALFVDDDIRELTDPELLPLVQAGRLHRLLFVRAGGKT